MCIYAHYNISVTDVECQWAIRKPKEEPAKPIEEIYVGQSHQSTESDLSESEIKKFREQLQDIGTPVGFTWLLADEPAVEPDFILDIEKFLFSEEYLNAEDKESSLLESLRVSQDEIRRISVETLGQNKNEKWLMARKNRLTASNFGPVLAAIGRNKYPPSLFKRLIGYYNLEGVKAIQWGVQHEAVAIQTFSEASGLTVEPTGLCLDECGFLGGSPDGLVGENATLEVKCPFKYREKNLQDELKGNSTYIISFDENGDLVNKNHDYYHQIQGCLEITQRQSCHLVIWTPGETIIVETMKDEQWKSNMDHLRTFYLEKYVPYLLGNAD